MRGGRTTAAAPTPTSSKGRSPSQSSVVFAADGGASTSPRELGATPRAIAISHRKTNKVIMIVCEDNESTIKIVLKKRSLALRHVPRMHRINLDSLYEVFDYPAMKLKHA